MISINGEKIDINKFPDGTLLLKYIATEEARVHWLFENNEELVALIYLAKHLRFHGVKVMTLNMPYLPNARQDRVKKPEDVFTLKYFAEVINSLGFDKVYVVDPHSSVSEALIDRLVVLNDTLDELHQIVINKLTRGDYMNEHGVTPLIMFYPDEGAMKRYSSPTNRPYAFGIKNRDWSTGEIKGLDVAGEVEQIKDGVVLIIDDICSRGGTFYHSAKKLRELGAKHIFLCITHCENSILEGSLLTGELIDRVFTTRSLFTQNHNKIEIIDV